MQGSGETVSEDFKCYHPATVLTLYQCLYFLWLFHVFPVAGSAVIAVTLLKALNRRGIFCDALAHLSC